MQIDIMSILGMLFSIAGNLLLARKSAIGFWCFLLGNIMWIGYSLMFNLNVPMIMQYSIFSVINVYGIYRYRKDKRDGTDVK